MKGGLSQRKMWGADTTVAMTLNKDRTLRIMATLRGARLGAILLGAFLGQRLSPTEAGTAPSIVGEKLELWLAKGPAQGHLVRRGSDGSGTWAVPRASWAVS